MIPKVIHYCWFGGKELDELALRCIESWKKFFPEYEIIQWNEDNFDISQIDFMKKAYIDRKWAFVSDVARLLIIYEYGGIYFDTDVEVIASYDDILNDNNQGFFAFEKTNCVATGLGFGAVQYHPFLKELIGMYKELDYDDYKECLSAIACPILTTRLMQKQGYVVKDTKQYSCGFVVYPSEYFSPIDYATGKLVKTPLTHSIHWYNASWHNADSKGRLVLEQRLRRIFGFKTGDNIAGIIWCIKKEGIINYIKRHLKVKNWN